MFSNIEVAMLAGGGVLCGFGEYILRRSRMFDCRPLAIIIIVIGFLPLVADFIEEVVDIIARSKIKDKNEKDS